MQEEIVEQQSDQGQHCSLFSKQIYKTSHAVKYHIYSALRQDFLSSYRNPNLQISPVQFGFYKGFSLPKQVQKSRSVLLDRSSFLGLFWRGKPCLIFQ